MKKYPAESKRLIPSELFLTIKLLPFLWSTISVLTIFYEFGFKQLPELHQVIRQSYFFTLIVGCIAIIFRYIIPSIRPDKKVIPIDVSLFVFYVAVFVCNTQILETPEWLNFFFRHRILIYAGVFVVFFRELSALRYRISKQYLNPAQLFIVSFLVLILAGSALLMLPNATKTEISFIDALFTSTSAVCVTGLVVVDTGSFFTKFGQVIIMGLIQAGGLGVMTFASYFSYFFQGGASYENQLMLRDMTNSEKVSEVFSILKRIILVTLGIELLGAVLVYFTLQGSPLHGFTNKVFFAVFHSVSAFCNAGFSTLPNNLYQEGFAFNYPLQLIIAALFILGGIGFPIVFNLYKYTRYYVLKIFWRLQGKNVIKHMPWIINVNTRIVLNTTFILLLVGTGLFVLFEFDNVLKHHQGLGKIVVALFNAAAPRTAGFNSVDFNMLEFSTIMIIFLLMWIGASPASTGGGIKTSTIAIATLNFISLARGKERIEIFNREIPYISIRRAFAIISLSLIVIGMSIFLLAYFDREKDLLHIAFECFSAYSTVGLSLGVTPHLSFPGKLVIIVVMLIGRVGTLTMLIAILRKIKYQNYKYPAEEILIN